MSDYSKFPQLHVFLDKIPYPISWHEVITTYPCFSHCYWVLIFIILTAFIRLITYLISKLIGRRLIGYDKYPPLPGNSKVSQSSYYLKLGQHVRYKRHISIQKYDLEKLSKRYCDSNVSSSQITSWFVACNEFHATNRLQRRKFREYLFPILVKLLCFSFGTYVVYDKKWIYDRSLFYEGWPQQQQLDCCIPDIKVLYLFHIGYYIYRLFSAVFIHRRTKDFVPSIIHHLVSLILLVSSYHAGLIRVGVVIILLHDPADIVLQSAKFFKLIQSEMLCNFFFALLCVTWLSTRVIIYPYHCLLSGFIDWNKHNSDPTLKIRLMGYILITLMCVLYALHLHWFKLLIEAVIRMIQGKSIPDGRSGSDNEITDSMSHVETNEHRQ